MTGRVEYRTATRTIVARRGDVALFRAGTEVDWRVPDGVREWRSIYSIFQPRPHWMAWLQHRDAAEGHLVLRPSPAVASAVRGSLMLAHRHFIGSDALRADFARLAVEQALLVLWKESAPADRRIDPRIASAVEFLTTNWSRPVKLQQVAARCGMSRSHVAALFKQQVGISPSRYQERLRIDRAMQMLRMTVDSVAQIARSVGFHDSQHFCNRFRHLVGETPRRYRLSMLAALSAKKP